MISSKMTMEALMRNDLTGQADKHRFNGLHESLEVGYVICRVLFPEAPFDRIGINLFEIPCNDSIINFKGLKFIGPVKFAPVKQKNEEV